MVRTVRVPVDAILSRHLSAYTVRAYILGLAERRPLLASDITRALGCDQLTTRSALRALEGAGLAVKTAGYVGDTRQLAAAWTMVSEPVQAA
jgi:hypothetical protein